MKLTAAFAAFHIFGAGPVVAQTADVEQLIRERYEPVASSVVCIRTVVRREIRMADPLSGLMGTIVSPVSLHGTGIVIGTVVENGRTEYLILTNDHVADPTRYFDMRSQFLRALKQPGEAAPVPRTSYVVDSWDDDADGDDVQLVEVARDPSSDAALLKTVGATEGSLQVFTGRIGYPAGGVPDAGRVITSGFRANASMITAVGELQDLHYEHALGGAHIDFSADVPLAPGQSGSPVFLVTVREGVNGPEVEFDLIALMHARDSGAKLMVPYALWSGLVATLGH